VILHGGNIDARLARREIVVKLQDSFAAVPFPAAFSDPAWSPVAGDQLVPARDERERSNAGRSDARIPFGP
jgi:hypothetical protein